MIGKRLDAADRSMVSQASLPTSWARSEPAARNAASLDNWNLRSIGWKSWVSRRLNQ
jgi:hypothetical protein